MMTRKPVPQPLALDESPSTADAEPAAAPEPGVDPRSPASLRSPPLANANSKETAKASTPSPVDDDKEAKELKKTKAVSPHAHKVSLDEPKASLDEPKVSVDDSSVMPRRSASPALRSPGASKRSDASPKGSKERQKPVKTGFFHFNKTSKGSNQLPATSRHQHQASREQLTSSGSDGVASSKRKDSPYAHDSLQKLSTPQPSRSELSLSSSVGDHDTASTPPQGKKSRSKPFALLGRTKSVRDSREQGSLKDPSPAGTAAASNVDLLDSASPGSAVAAPDRLLREMSNSMVRNGSQDRTPSRDAKDHHGRDRDPRPPPPSQKENGGGSTFLSGLRSSSTKAADMISKGLFGKHPRNSSGGPDKEASVDDEHYALKVITLPLVEQTRLTRISKRLEHSRDKTEFWMPAFPWRAIDYLNYKGCDVEGLYRVPGSGPQVKKWQRKFDEQYDVNLFEEEDLYDINIIGSMLKAWLRELPDELFPKEAQDRISRECAGSTEVPQMLIDELSNLSPFNYYLLFAITCHLSLLLAHSDKNKMDFRNLCICFQPCMKIDAFCFKFLVCDWRDCWKGCKNEAKYIEEEYGLFEQPLPRGLTEPQQPIKEDKAEERTAAESSAKSTSSSSRKKLRSKKDDNNGSGSNVSVRSNGSSKSGSHSERNIKESHQDIRPLSPIKPLSPLGF
ncbi:RhoGAP domain containing protein [Ophiocordyceps camponoti-floridani]|uniref:RhoGAP domain containing protein n=1 Tax=Ophiocordyceps camponoti-floridani TaxID=2030778 RepID=A0A8H4Q0Q6_9HYPO|nr:RhoGAP domain containing protein [Ophiocordyceps camponoti-floridani]